MMNVACVCVCVCVCAHLGLMFALQLTSSLAVGTQVLLETTDDILGGDSAARSNGVSKWAAQPSGFKAGLRQAARSLQRGLSSAADTVIAVPMGVRTR